MHNLDFVTDWNIRNRPMDFFNVGTIWERASGGNPITLFESKVSAGFPSPAAEFAKDRLSADSYLVKNDTCTYFVEVEGDSMIDAGIFDGDIVVVDKSLDANIGDFIVAEIEGKFTVKELGRQCLIPHNPRYPVIYFKGDIEVMLFGVVTGSMRKFKK